MRPDEVFDAKKLLHHRWWEHLGFNRILRAVTGKGAQLLFGKAAHVDCYAILWKLAICGGLDKRRDV